MRHYYLRRRSEGGKWYVILMNINTKKQEISRCTGTYDEKQAHQIAQEWLVNGPPDSNRISKDKNKIRYTVFCDYLLAFWDYDTSEYIKEKITEGKQPKKTHLKDMKGIINRYYKPYFKDKLLCEITEEKLTEFLVYLKTEKNKERKSANKEEQEKGLSSSTVKSARNAAIVPLRHAKRKKIIRTFDFDAVIKPNGDYVERGILNRDQVEALFKQKWRDIRAYLICKIASQTVMRLGEIRALRICDIFEDHIYVQHSWSENDGGLKCTKNRANRIIPILPELYQEIINYIKIMKISSGLDNLLFPGKIEGKPYCQKQINKEFHLMLEKIGISENERREINIVFHSWRHYGAKHLAENTDRNTGMAILGHKTPNLYDRYANHADKETFNKMSKAVKESFGTQITVYKDNTIPFPKAVCNKQEVNSLDKTQASTG